MTAHFSTNQLGSPAFQQIGRDRMNTWETSAIIRLVDHLSGPLKSLAGSVASIRIR
jgi:hypothetical protein